MQKNISLLILSFLIGSGVIRPQKGFEVIMPSPIANIITDLVILNKTTAWATGTLGSVMRTTDAGINWQTLKTGEDIWLSSIAAVDVEKAWATGPDENLISTTDGGKTWKTEKIGKIKFFSKVQFIDSQNGFVAGSAILSDDQAEGIYQLYVTSDGGKTWQMRNSSLGFSPLEVHFTNLNDGYAIERYDVVTGKDKLLKTTNGGKNWEIVKEMSNIVISNMTFPDEKNGYVITEILEPAGSSVVSRIVIFKTVDGGKSWNSSKFYDISADIKGQMIFSINFQNSNTGWVLLSGGLDGPIYTDLYRTVDGGKTWQKSYSHKESGFAKVAFFDDKTGLVLPAFWDLMPKIYRSTDGGNTFNQIVKGIDLHFNAFYFIDSKKGFATDVNGLVKTTDGGKSWILVSAMKASYFEKIKFFNDKEGVAICYDDAGSTFVLSTTDGGEKWKNLKVQFHGFPQKMTFLNLQTCYAFSLEVDKRILKKSDDGGKTWKELLVDSAPEGQFNDLFFIDENTGWMMGDVILPGAKKNGGLVSYIKKTTDGGASWSETYLNDQTFPSNIKFLDQKHGWYTSSVNDTSYALWRTTDGGEKWESSILSNTQDITEGIHFIDPNNGWMLKAYGAPLSPSFVYRSKDGGKTWEFEKLVNKVESLQFLEDKTIFGGGYNNLIKITDR